MSEAVNYIKVQDVTFVLPAAGNMVFTRIHNNDRLLCFTITKGYIETVSYASCVILAEFLVQTSKTKFRLIGGIAKVKTSDGITDSYVYRQRVCFTDLILLLKIFEKVDVVFKVANTFKISDGNIAISKKDKEAVVRLAYKNDMNYLSWLTLTLKMQLELLCREMGVKYDTPTDVGTDEIVLVNAPYILTGFNVFGKNAVVAVFAGESKSTGYAWKIKNKIIQLNGYTKRNVSRYRL